MTAAGSVTNIASQTICCRCTAENNKGREKCLSATSSSVKSVFTLLTYDCMLQNEAFVLPRPL